MYFHRVNGTNTVSSVVFCLIGIDNHSEELKERRKIRNKNGFESDVFRWKCPFRVRHRHHSRFVVKVCSHEMFTCVFACSRLSRAPRVQTFNCTNGMDVSVKMKGNHSLAIYCCWPRTTTQTHDHDDDSICQWLRRARKALSNDHFITIGGACENEQTMNSYITHSARKISRIFWRLLHPDGQNGHETGETDWVNLGYAWNA